MGTDKPEQRRRQDRTRPGAEEIRLDHRAGNAINPHDPVKVARSATVPVEPGRKMILQIIADWQIDDRRDAKFAKMLCRSDAGQHEELGAVEHAGTDHDLATRARLVQTAASAIFDPSRSRAGHQQPCGLGVGLQAEIATPQRRMQIGSCRGMSPAIVDRKLDAAKAFARGPIEIVGRAEASRFRGLDPCREQRLRRPRALDAKRSRTTAPGILAVFPRLSAFEVRQHFAIRPASGAFPSPTIVIAAIATGVSHDIDRV